MAGRKNISELNEAVARHRPIGGISRPAGGWLRPIREALGVTLTDLAKRLKVTPPAIRSFEQAEAEDRITLASLRRTADALGCDLIYALVPRSGSWSTLASDEAQARRDPTSPVPQRVVPPPPELPVGDDAAKKVTDLTWRTLHSDS